MLKLCLLLDWTGFAQQKVISVNINWSSNLITYYSAKILRCYWWKWPQFSSEDFHDCLRSAGIRMAKLFVWVNSCLHVFNKSTIQCICQFFLIYPWSYFCCFQEMHAFGKYIYWNMIFNSSFVPTHHLQFSCVCTYPKLCVVKMWR